MLTIPRTRNRPQTRDDDLLTALLNVFCPVPSEADAVLLESLWDRWRLADLSRLTDSVHQAALKLQQKMREKTKPDVG